MIYVDSSVLLAKLLVEDRKPPDSLWDQPLVSSRLAEYEVWVRMNASKLGAPYIEATRQLLSRISFLELSPVVLGRALEPYPVPLRALDALHLASVEYLQAQRSKVRLASFDERMNRAATRLGIDLEPL